MCVLSRLTLWSRPADNRCVKTVRTAIWVWVLLSAIAAYPVESAATYRDPGNRFTLQTPAGWKARPLGDSVQVVRGDAYVSVLIFEHVSDAGTLVEDLGRNMVKKWRRFELAGREDSMLSGNRAAVITFSGVNPQGAEAILRLSGVVSDGSGYVLVTGSPKADLPKVQDTLTQIEASFSLLQSRSSTRTSGAPTLGIEVADLDGDDASAYGTKEPTGALVVDIRAQRPGASAGLALHDLIVSADRQAIDSAATLEQLIRSHKPGDTMELEFLRLSADGTRVERQTCKVTVGIARAGY